MTAKKDVNGNLKFGWSISLKSKQCHAGAELEVIGRWENFVQSKVLEVQHRSRAFNEALSQDRMTQVALSFVRVADAEMPRCLSLTETPELREDVPHPVPALGAGSEFAQGRLILIYLRRHEAVDWRQSQVFHYQIATYQSLLFQ